MLFFPLSLHPCCPAPPSLALHDLLSFVPPTCHTLPVSCPFLTPLPTLRPKVKVWFQNRRTKQKKDQSRDLEKRTSSSASEAFATSNILRLLEQGRLLSVPRAPGLVALSPGPLGLPAGHRGTSPGDPRKSSPCLNPLTSASASPPLPPPPPALCFSSAPLLDLPACCELGSSAFEPYSRLERRVGSPGGGKKANV